MYVPKRHSRPEPLSENGTLTSPKNRNARSVSATICSRSRGGCERQTERESAALRSRRLPHVPNPEVARSRTKRSLGRLRATSRNSATPRDFAPLRSSRGLPLRLPLSNLLFLPFTRSSFPPCTTTHTTHAWIMKAFSRKKKKKIHISLYDSSFHAMNSR